MFNQYGIKNSSLSRTVHLSYKSMDVNVKEDKKKWFGGVVLIMLFHFLKIS